MDNSNHKSSKLIVEIGAKVNEESFKEVERRFEKLLDMLIKINKLREEIDGKNCISRDDISNISIEGFKKDMFYTDRGIETIVFSKER